MKLISMTEFVIKSHNTIEDVGDSESAMYNYANFLNQPLTLGMFIACDEYGNVLDSNEWKLFDGQMSEYSDILLKHKQANDKVLFEGFEVFDNNKNIEISNRRINLFFSIRNWVGILEVDKTIRISRVEDLVKYNLTLTPNAIKK